MRRADIMVFGGKRIAMSQRRDIDLVVSQSYSGLPIVLPMTVWRAAKPGPTVFVSAAVHGDELNGTGIVRALILDPPFDLSAGTLVLVPVVNMLGFDRHVRYLPDRRDLNRVFPGSADGSLASRFAHTIVTEIVSRCDYGIDLHTGAIRRTNFPNVRGDLENPGAARLAEAFGCELIVNSKGPRGSLRRSACKAGCPTVILEAGEVWKIEPTVVECGVRGIRNALIGLGMVAGERVEPPYQAFIDKTTWIRADRGGMLHFHVAPGDVIECGQPIATNADLRGRELKVIYAPADGVVLGMTTLPAVTPGDPVCQLAIPRGGIAPIRAALKHTDDTSLHERIRDDLSSSMTISDRPAGDA